MASLLKLVGFVNIKLAMMDISGTEKHNTCCEWLALPHLQTTVRDWALEDTDGNKTSAQRLRQTKEGTEAFVLNEMAQTEGRDGEPK